MFNDGVNKEFMEYKKGNSGEFTWWDYINIKSDLKTALGFSKFFYPDILEVEECFILKDKFSKGIFELWKNECENDKVCIEKMMNLYRISDFFQINIDEDENEEEQVLALGKVLKIFWTHSFNDKFPNRDLVVEVFEEDDGELFITAYENLDLE